MKLFLARVDLRMEHQEAARKKEKAKPKLVELFMQTVCDRFEADMCPKKKLHKINSGSGGAKLEEPLP